MRKTIITATFTSLIALAGITPPAFAQGYKQIYSFAGGRHGFLPDGVTGYRGILFGATVMGGGSPNCRGGGCGTLFSVDPKTGKQKVIYVFEGTDGRNPSGEFINSNGVLYSTSYRGGSAGYGTVFSFNPSTHSESVIYSFKGGNDGISPNAPLLNVNSTFYGVTNGGGGPGDHGTVFSVDPTTGVERVVYSFQSGSDGSFPSGNLIEVNGLLYGTTFEGGASQAGTIFSVDPTTGSEKVVHTFRGADGSAPDGSLTKVGNKLYGATAGGGANDQGVLFSVDIRTGAEQVIYSFTYGHGSRDGSSPSGSLLNINGVLYGITANGGRESAICSHGCGTLFSFDLATGIETVLYTFGKSDDGVNPNSDLVDVGGALYGTTEFGGTANKGTVFEITP